MFLQYLEHETIALVKDAIEFCDIVPMQDQRTKQIEEPKQKSPTKVTHKENSNIEKEKEPSNEIIDGQYVPEFNDSQRKQLDEQLRNVNTNYNI